jgi:hypothetical protein
MHNCEGCHRPTGRGWIVCGWCGANQVARAPRKRFFSRIAGYVLLLQAMAVAAASIGLGVVWAQSGWSVERAQLLGVIWLGVIIVLAFLAWVSININRSEERTPLFALRDRQLT